MRTALIAFILVLAVGFAALDFARFRAKTTRTHLPASSSFVTPVKKPDFDADIKPILQSRCMPCHFQGGKVYDKMPFDKPETVTRLGEKMFTRIKDEKEQRVIREFLAQP